MKKSKSLDLAFKVLDRESVDKIKKQLSQSEYNQEALQKSYSKTLKERNDALSKVEEYRAENYQLAQQVILLNSKLDVAIQHAVNLKTKKT